MFPHQLLPAALGLQAPKASQSICAGGKFRLELFLPEDYPMAAPKVRLCVHPESAAVKVSLQLLPDWTRNAHVPALFTAGQVFDKDLPSKY